MRLLTTEAGNVAVGAVRSIWTLIVRKPGNTATGAFAACAFVSAGEIVTFGFGEAGAGVTIEAILTVSRLSPVSMTSSSPTTRPVVLARRIAVAPAAAAWL